MAKIILMHKDTVLSEIPLEKSVTNVGRAPGNDIAIDNLAVSSFHAEFVNENGVFTIQDLNSTNGTFVNDRRVSRITLQNNDVITVGKLSLVFSDPPREDDPDSTQRNRRRISEETVMVSGRNLPCEPTPSSSSSVAGPLGGFTVIDGPVERRDYRLSGRLTTIGKSKTADIRLQGFFAPRVAALVNRGKEGYSISPSGGRHKVQINGIPVEGRQLLQPCDIVEIWKVKLQFYLND